MKILRVFAKNVYGIEELDLEADGKSIMITGGNGQGKTSILKAIQTGVWGAADGAVREGATKGQVIVEMEEMTIDRVFTGDSNRVTVKRDGKKQKAPQSVLSSIAKSLLFNPVSFFTSKPREQRNMLLDAVPMSVDANTLTMLVDDAFDGANGKEEIVRELIETQEIDWSKHALEVVADIGKAFYDLRHQRGSEISILESMKGVEDEDEVEWDQADFDAAKDALRQAYDDQESVSQEMDAIRDAERELKSIESQVSSKRETLDRNQAEIGRLHQRIAELEKDNDLLEGSIENLNSELEETKDRSADFEDVKARAEEAQEDVNEKLQRFEELKESKLKAEIAEKNREKSKDVMVRIEKLSAEREKLDALVKAFRDEIPKLMIEDAEFPVKGLSVTDDAVLIDGRPVDTLSEAEKFELALAIAEAHASDEKGMQFVLLDGAERLDPTRLEQLEERAKNGKIQYFVTRVSEGPVQWKKAE